MRVGLKITEQTSYLNGPTRTRTGDRRIMQTTSNVPDSQEVSICCQRCGWSAECQQHKNEAFLLTQMSIFAANGPFFSHIHSLIEELHTAFAITIRYTLAVSRVSKGICPRLPLVLLVSPDFLSPPPRASCHRRTSERRLG